MKILVAGHRGFIGTNLVAHLLTLGHEVVGIDNLCTGGRQVHDIEEYVGDVSLVDESSKYLFRNWDVVFNLACPASPPEYQKRALFTLDTCYIGTRNLASIASRASAIFVHASTSEVYGDPTVSPQPETYQGNVNSYGVRSCYDEGKRVAESLCHTLRESGLEVRIPRIFNTYGPFMKVADGRVVSNFVNQALRNSPLSVYGDGAQTRSLCYVDDLIKGFMLLLDSGISSPVNLGNPVELTVKQIAELVINLSGSSSTLYYLPALPDDPRQRCPDITIAKTLGFNPSVTAEDGLKKTIQYFEGLL